MDSVLRTYSNSGEFLYDSTSTISYSLLSLVPGVSVYPPTHFISKATERHIEHTVLELKIKHGWFVRQMYLMAIAMQLS